MRECYIKGDYEIKTPNFLSESKKEKEENKNK